MKRQIQRVAAILCVLMTASTLEAELRLAENFEDPLMVGDGSNLTGVLGGFFDSQSEGTGNHNVETQDGSRLIQYRGHSSGTSSRGWAISALENPIGSTEIGTLFFRFVMRVDGGPAYNWYGIHDFPPDNTNPLTGATDEPEEIVAGFMLRSVAGAAADVEIRTPDEGVFLRKVVKGQWYNVWIAADNSTDTYDLYMNEAEGPAGPPPDAPSAADQLLSGHPFNKATDEPLAGMMTFFPGRMPPGYTAQQTARYWTDEIWWDGDQGLKAPTTASSPSPANNVANVFHDVVLTWADTEFAASHDVYFGTSIDDVSDGSEGTLIGDGIAGTRFDVGRVEFDSTYYWRVDEVNGAPDFAVFKGETWSFQVEPLSIPILQIIATASSTFGTSGPEKTLDGSGLVDELHGTSAGDMWISASIPATIEYSFDRAYKLHELWIWNSNQLIEAFVGFGAKDVVIEHSLDGDNWTVLEGAGPLAQAPGVKGYVHNNTIDLEGATAQHVRLTVNSVHGIAPQASLSEVRFFAIPTTPTRPNPETGATDVAADVTLGWGRDGREAARHDIYLGSDPDTLALVGSVTESSFDTRASDLQLGQTHYWQVVEVNDAMDPSEWAGDVWRFTTVQSIVIDDMESYEDAEFLEIWATWIDGFDDPANGSLAGNGAAGTPETGIVQGGRQSLPIHFDNAGVPFSEVTRTFEQTQDWTRSGVQSLVLYFKRGPDDTGGNVYVKINDTKRVYEAAAGLPPGWDAWTQWTIDLSGLGDAARVRSLTIGVEGAGASGVLYVDSIELYKNAPTAFQPLSWFEAEAADVIGASWKVVADPTASGGNRIGSEDGDGNDNDAAPAAEWVASYSFTVAADGVYGLALRAQEAGADSFWVRIVGALSQSHEDPNQAGTGWVRFNGIDAPDGWAWDQVHSNDHGDAVVSWTLPAGPLTLEIGKREDGTYLDAIALMK